MGDRAQGLWKTAMRFAQVARASSGSIPAVPQYCTDTRQVSACHWELRSCNRRNGFPSACHCEERSDGTIRFSLRQGITKQQYLGRIREA